MKYSSLVIIVLVALSVFGAAGLILERTFLDTNSNIHVAERVAQDIIDRSSLRAQESDVAEFDPGVVAGAETCDPGPVEPGTISLVNYLVEKGFPATYKDRVALAEKYNMSDYRGREEQNVRLLNYVSADYARDVECKNEPKS